MPHRGQSEAGKIVRPHAGEDGRQSDAITQSTQK